MATKSKNSKGVNYNCEAFQHVRDDVKAALETSNYRSESLGDASLQKLAKNAFGVLVSEKILTTQGKPISEGRYAYILGVLPFFSSYELRILEEDPKSFAEKFCLHPSRRDEKSLALILYKNEDPLRVFGMDKQWISKNLQVFEEFREFTKVDEEDPGLSPFERANPDILEDFLFKDDSLLY